MAKARALDKRRKSIRNIRKITRTMELIATSRFKKAMDRATQAAAYTRKINEIVADLAARISGGNTQVFGVMIESHLLPGNQKFTPGRDDPRALAHGVSITDACIGWDDSVRALEALDRAVTTRRKERP